MSIEPKFLWPFSRWKWLTGAVPAERVAAVRIAVAVALLIDLLLGCLPQFHTLFTAKGLAGGETYSLRFREGTLYWSLLRWLPDAWGPHALMAVWIVAAVGVLVGYRVFVTALVCWACAVSFWNVNPWVCNGGDQLRNALLLTVACIGLVPPSPRGRGVRGEGDSSFNSPSPLTPLPRGEGGTSGHPTRGGGDNRAPAWPLRVMLVQMCCMYFFSAWYKLKAVEWRDGSVMYYVNHNRTWSMCPDLTSALPVWLHFASTWVTLAWELSFPLLVLFRRTRTPALLVGVGFHVASLFTLEVGSFATYSLVYYVPFVPWERWRNPTFREGRAGKSG